jgi:hypothetical protein
VKRGFLFGLGSFLILCAVSGIGRIVTSHADAAGIILALLGVPLSLAAIRAANRAPPNKSKLYAVIGWFLGFLVIVAVAPAVFFGVWAFAR